MKKVIPLNKLVEQFERMPGIGHKSAQRLAFHILSLTDEEIKDFTETIVEAHDKIHRCSICCDLTDQEVCKICSDENRDKTTVCVVENSKDVSIKTTDTDIAANVQVMLEALLAIVAELDIA